ncbi:MAG: hypothetical protein ABI681_12920 [Gemmatimonadales bacterium]
MTRRTRPLSDEDLAPVATLLRGVFGDRAGPRFADPDVLRWKYLESCPAWDGARAFVVEQDGAVVAFAGFTPTVFLPPGGDSITTLTVIDWAATPTAPGVGVALYAQLIRRAETAFLIRGAEVMRSVAPRLGFKPIGEITVYACWFRPWREFLTREKSLRSLQRLAHGLLHRSPRYRGPGSTWQSERVKRFDARIDTVLGGRARDRITCRRTVASLNHMLDCPLVRMEGHLLRNGGIVRGYLIVAYIGWEARLVDLNIDSEHCADWMAAYGVATDVARVDPQVCRLRVMSGIPVQQQALELQKYWVNQREPLLLFDPKKRMPPVPLDIQFFESDAAFT